MPLTYAFRLAPGPQALDQAMLAEKLGYERVWSPEVPAFGHDIWVHLARIAERTERIGIGPAVLIPSYRHPVAQDCAIATLEHMAPGRLMAGRIARIVLALALGTWATLLLLASTRTPTPGSTAHVTILAVVFGFAAYKAWPRRKATESTHQDRS